MLSVVSGLSQEQAPGDILVNTGFEWPAGGRMPDGWIYYTSDLERGGLATNTVGTQCARLAAQGIAGAFQGFYQTRTAVTGAHYRITGKARNDPNNPLSTNAYLQLVVEWRDWAGIEIIRHWSSNVDAAFLKRGGWRSLPVLEVAVPESAAEGIFGFHLFDGPGNSTGAVQVDDVVVTIVP